VPWWPWGGEGGEKSGRGEMLTNRGQASVPCAACVPADGDGDGDAGGCTAAFAVTSRAAWVCLAVPVDLVAELHGTHGRQSQRTQTLPVGASLKTVPINPQDCTRLAVDGNVAYRKHRRR
jgi:hypothetical protein